MDGENNTSSSTKENRESNKTKIIKELNLDKILLLKRPTLNEIHVSPIDPSIKFSHPIKHFSSLNDIDFRYEGKNTNLKSPFNVNKENAFGYRILFEAFSENMDKKKNSIIEDKENDEENLGIFRI